MTSSPAPEFDTFLRDFITSNARTIFAAFPPSGDHDGTDPPLVFTVYSNQIGIPIKSESLPASKSAIEALPTVTVLSEEECAICLTEYGVAGEAKQMPCNHRYHSDCIMKWLGIHGSCPVCRFQMPVDEEEEKRRRDGGGVAWQVMITVTSGGAPVSESDRSGLDLESNEQSVEDMDIDLGNGDSMEDLD